MANDKLIPPKDVEPNEATKAGADLSAHVQTLMERTGSPTERIAINDTGLLTDTGRGNEIISPEAFQIKFANANLPPSEQNLVVAALDFHVDQAIKANNPALAAAMQAYRPQVTTA
jgi:hypothetical protein